MNIKNNKGPRFDPCGTHKIDRYGWNLKPSYSSTSERTISHFKKLN